MWNGRTLRRDDGARNERDHRPHNVRIAALVCGNTFLRILVRYIWIDSKETEIWVHRGSEQSSAQTLSIDGGPGGTYEVTVTFETGNYRQWNAMIQSNQSSVDLRQRKRRKLFRRTERSTEVS